MSDEQWWIYSDGEIIGAFTVAQLYRMRNDHELPGASQFYSNRRRDWFPISGLLFDITPQVIRILTMTSVGITKCKILGAGYDVGVTQRIKQSPPGRGCPPQPYAVPAV